MKDKRFFLLGLVLLLSLSFVGVGLAGANRTQTLLANSVVESAPETPAGGILPVEVLLVDDDNNGPNVLNYYTQILDALGYTYNVWDTGGSDNEPPFAVLEAYEAVIWFTGSASGFAGPQTTSEAELASYLDNGGCFFITSQEYSNDRGLTPFMINYLGVDETVLDLGDFTAVVGAGSTYGDLSPFSLIYPYGEKADIVSPTVGAEVAFAGLTPNQYPAGVYHDGGAYKTTYLGYPLDTAPPFDGAEVVKRFLVDCALDDVMLVDDDDNAPDVLATYTQILDQLGYHYTIWDTDGSDSEPSAAILENYEAVVWFSGDAFGGTAGPGGQSETELTTWLEGSGACLFLSSQDYLYDRGLTPFMIDYLGVSGSASSNGDVTQTVVTGTLAYAGLGPYDLITGTVSNFSDVFSLTLDAQPAFFGDKTSFPFSKTHNTPDSTRIIQSVTNEAVHPVAGAYKETVAYKTTWLGFPIELLPSPLAQLRTIHRFLADCFPSDLQTIKTASSPVVQVGEIFTYTVTVVNNGAYRASQIFVQDFIPNTLAVVDILPSQSANCLELGNGNVNCTIDALDPGQAEQILIVVDPLQPGETTNFVFSTNFMVEDNPANNSTSAFVRVLAPGDDNVYLDKVVPNVVDRDAGGTIQVFGANFLPITQLLLNGTPISFTQEAGHPDAILEVTIPSDFETGEYTLLAQNTAGNLDTLFKGLIVYDPDALKVDAVVPHMGANDRAMMLNIAGDGFVPGMMGELIDSNNPLLIYPLETPSFVSENLVRALVPYGTPAGVYDVRLVNPAGISDTLSMAYESLDWTTADDLGAFDFDFFTIPAAPREGDDVIVGLTVRRRTGEEAPFSSGQVSVDVNLGVSGGELGPDITLGGSGVISPNGTISITFPWNPALAGDYHLTLDISSSDLLTDTIASNNQIDRYVAVLPASTDSEVPVISALTINGGAWITAVPAVLLNTTASDVGSGLDYIYYIEYVFDRNLGDWYPVNRSNWLPFDSASEDFNWVLAPVAGVHYLQAWVSDQEGNISQPFTSLINLIAAKNHIGHDDGQIYRLPLLPASFLQVDLTSLTGDADLYVWAPDGTLAAAAFGGEPFEQVIIDTGVNAPGLYQFDVYGYENTSYWFETSTGGSLDTPLSIDEVQGHVKGGDQTLQVVDNNPGSDVNIPTPPGDETIYLPLIVR